MQVMWILAVRNLLRHKARTAMTLFAVAAGVAALILSGGFVADMLDQLAESIIHSQSGYVQVAKAGFHEQGTRSPEQYLIKQPEALQQEIARLPAVKAVMGRVSFSGLISNYQSDWSIIGEGLEADKEAQLGSHLEILEGRQLTDQDQFGILLGAGVAHALKLHPGDEITLLINTAEGALNSLEFEVIGVFQSFSKDYDDRAVRIPLSAAQDLLGSQGVNTLVLDLHRRKDTAAVVSELRRFLDSSSAAETKQEGQGVQDGAGFAVLDWENLNDFYKNAAAMYAQQFGVLQIIVLVLVLLSVGNNVNMSVSERLGEFGTLRALGDRSRVIFQLVLVENTVLGLAGALLGLLLGGLLALLISAIGIPMPPPPNANLGYVAHILLIPATLLMAFGVGLAATFFAALLPALRVSRTDIVTALRENI